MACVMSPRQRRRIAHPTGLCRSPNCSKFRPNSIDVCSAFVSSILINYYIVASLNVTLGVELHFSVSPYYVYLCTYICRSYSVFCSGCPCLAFA